MQIGWHQYVEFAGLMGEYINILKDAQVKRGDLGALELADYQVSYIGEKLDCIFGEELRKVMRP